MKKLNLKGVGIKVLGATAGAVAARQADKINLPGNLPAWVKPLGVVAIGAFLPKIAKQKPGSLIDTASTVMMGVGGADLVAAFVPALGGIGGMPVLGNVGRILYRDENYAGATLNGTEAAEDKVIMM